LVISGHGYGAGINTKGSGNELSGYTITLPVIELINDRLEKDAPIFILGCGCGSADKEAQYLSDITKRKVISNTEHVEDGNISKDGIWVLYKPQNK
jgi:fructoselysine-6-P-deglycase FrlB-like protein